LSRREAAHFLTNKNQYAEGISLWNGSGFMASSTRRVSIDSWAVGLALLAALLVRFGIVKTVPW
jgi:hypothetical protein